MQATPDRQVWMNPQRDIAHAFPDYIYRATAILEKGTLYRFFDVFEAEGGKPEQVGEVVRFWQRYFENCSSAEYSTQKEAFNDAGFESLDMRAVGVAATSLMFVVLSAYYVGLQEATFSTRPDENPDRSWKQAEPQYLRTDGGPVRRWIRRRLYRLFGRILHAI